MSARLVALSLFLCAGLFAPVATAASCCEEKTLEEPVLLEGTVQELSERPERVYELVRSALSKHGWGEKVEVDYTLHGGVTLFCE